MRGEPPSLLGTRRPMGPGEGRGDGGGCGEGLARCGRPPEEEFGRTGRREEDEPGLDPDEPGRLVGRDGGRNDPLSISWLPLLFAAWEGELAAWGNSGGRAFLAAHILAVCGVLARNKDTACPGRWPYEPLVATDGHFNFREKSTSGTREPTRFRRRHNGRGDPGSAIPPSCRTALSLWRTC